MLYNIIVALIVIICILLTIVVLLQPGQGQGLSGGLAGGMGGQGGPNMGARRTADLLSKSTSILGASFLVLCVLANFAINRGDNNRSAVQESGVPAAPANQNQNIDFNNPSESSPAIPQQSGSQGSEGGSGSNDGNSDGSDSEN